MVQVSHSRQAVQQCGEFAIVGCGSGRVCEARVQLCSLGARVEINEACDEDSNEVEVSQRENSVSQPSAYTVMVDS